MVVWTRHDGRGQRALLVLLSDTTCVPYESCSNTEPTAYKTRGWDFGYMHCDGVWGVGLRDVIKVVPGISIECKSSIKYCTRESRLLAQ